MMGSLDESAEKLRRKKQIDDILKKCDEIEVAIDEKLKKNEIGHGGRRVVVYEEGQEDS